MKLGTDSPVKTGFAAVLALIAILLVVRMYFGGGAAEQTSANPARPVTKNTSKPVSSLDPTLRTDLLHTSEDTKYEGRGRNIFLAQAEPLPEVKTPVINKNPEPIVNTPPAPPPINLKFIGFASKPGQPKQIFLMQNEDVFVAKEGEIVNRRYKVVKINPGNVEIEDVLNNNRQSIPLTQG